MAAHAKLSASKGKRWINCAGSVAAEEAVPRAQRRSGSTVYADEGTAAHSLVERCLAEKREGLLGDPHWFIGQTDLLVDGEGRVTWVAHGRDAPQHLGPHRRFPVDADMADAVQVTVDATCDIVQRLGGWSAVEVHLEKKWDLTWLDPDLGGTSDVTVDCLFEELVILDHKHGKSPKGVVEVEWNVQLLIYLLAAAKATQFSHDRYTIVVSQPRAYHHDGPVRDFSVTRDELLEFMGQVEAAAKATREPDAPLVPGEWCDWCEAAPTCAALARFTAEAAGMDFDDFPDETFELERIHGAAPDELARHLAWVPIVEAWCKAVNTAGQRLAEAGQKVQGYKLVRGKSNRKWALDEARVFKLLSAEVPDPSKLRTEPKLVSPAQAEKLSKAAKLLVQEGLVEEAGGTKVITPLTCKPPGKVTLAPESDPRPEVDFNSLAQDDFDDDAEG